MNRFRVPFGLKEMLALAAFLLTLWAGVRLGVHTEISSGSLAALNPLSLLAPGFAHANVPEGESQPEYTEAKPGSAIHAHFDEEDFGRKLPLWSVTPFVLLLLAIAVLPLMYHHWWESNLHKGYVTAALAIVPAIYFFIEARPALEHTLLEFISFIILLGSLYTVSGGIYLKGDVHGTPRNNTLLLAAGALMASLIGTTGASMLLIRMVLRVNQDRQRKVHTFVFFIFLVSNIGGSLTPLGDPPLFLGYLRGVPFVWTLSLLPVWFFSICILLFIYYRIERRAFHQDIRLFQYAHEKHGGEPIRFEGAGNFLLLFGIIISVLYPAPYREINMFLFAIAGYILANKEAQEKNQFNFNAIIEVAVLFIGIFITMVPALMILKVRGGSWGIVEPWQFFWATGGLSSFLDNAPTYLNFFSLAQGLAVKPEPIVAEVSEHILTAISLGAVFMGANTYIGNGPNFMVKTICEEAGVKMPSFFGYMGWSMAILIPLFLVITWVFIL